MRHRKTRLPAWVAGLASVYATMSFAADTQRSDSLEAVIVTAERVRETPPSPPITTPPQNPR